MELFPAEIKAFPQWAVIFQYNEGVLYWKKDMGARAKEGCVAGTLTDKGYVRIALNGKLYRRSRIVWEMHNGSIPENMQIDHINHIRYDDRIENLRLVTHKENGRNQSKKRNNTSGVNGVTFHKSTNKWQARIGVDGTSKYLGVYDTFEDAQMAVSKALTDYNFHKNHGCNKLGV